MPRLRIAGLNAEIAARLAASDAAVKAGLTEKPAPKDADDKPARKQARKR